MFTRETTLARQQHGLDALRIQAEIETADRATTKRPTWAPAVELAGELLELCRELEFLKPDDKPVARLWAVFADPKHKGTVIRSTYSKLALPGIRCRGFEMRVGTKHDGDRITYALMGDLGDWSVGHLSWRHSDLSKMRSWISKYESEIADIRRRLKSSPRPPPREVSGDKSFQEFTKRENARELARWSGSCRFCCKSRKSDDTENLAKIDFWTSLPLLCPVAKLRKSVVDFG